VTHDLTILLCIIICTIVSVCLDVCLARTTCSTISIIYAPAVLGHGRFYLQVIIALILCYLSVLFSYVFYVSLFFFVFCDWFLFFCF